MHIDPGPACADLHGKVTTTLSLDGSFSRVPVENLRIAPEKILWSDTLIYLGISDTRGIKAWTLAVFDGKPLTMGPGVQ